ncbi:MAG: hypothetical protein WAL50_06220 [Kineosporiaceae bacterium]
MTKAGDQLSVRRVFGEPIERNGVTVIPVAVALGGGGGGTGPDGQGAGGGFGGIARGIGVYAISDGQIRFVPAIDVVALSGIALLLTRTLTRAVRHHRHHAEHHPGPAGVARRPRPRGVRRATRRG